MEGLTLEGSSIYRHLEKTKEKEQNKETFLESFRFGCLVQPWTANVLALEIGLYNHNICAGETYPTDQTPKGKNRNFQECLVASQLAT